MNKSALILMALITVMLSLAVAQSPKPQPAFAGQTEAPTPAKTSSVTVETITNRLSNPWSIAFLPDGNFLVTEAYGTMRIIGRNGVVLRQ